MLLIITLILYIHSQIKLIKGEDKPVMKDGKQVVKDGVPQTKAQMIQKEGTYPFTIKVNRQDAESITTPSVIRIGWDVVTNMENYVTYYPKYSEANVGISIDDVDIILFLVDITSNNSFLLVKSLFATILHHSSRLYIHFEK